MEPVYMSIRQQETGQRIRNLMKENDLSVRDIQEAMGFANPQAVYKWITGKSLPSLDNLLILSRVLNKHMDDILVFDGDFPFLGERGSRCFSRGGGGFIRRRGRTGDFRNSPNRPRRPLCFLAP